jgi:hypothetical protein
MYLLAQGTGASYSQIRKGTIKSTIPMTTCLNEKVAPKDRADR